jgi:hypothetical protein
VDAVDARHAPGWVVTIPGAALLGVTAYEVLLLVSSGRRFIARPITYTALVNLLPLAFRLGVPPIPAEGATPRPANHGPL